MQGFLVPGVHSLQMSHLPITKKRYHVLALKHLLYVKSAFYGLKCILHLIRCPQNPSEGKAIRLGTDIDARSFQNLLHYGLEDRFPGILEKFREKTQLIEQKELLRRKEIEAEFQSQIPMIRSAVARLGFPHLQKHYPCVSSLIVDIAIQWIHRSLFSASGNDSQTTLLSTLFDIFQSDDLSESACISSLQSST